MGLFILIVAVALLAGGGYGWFWWQQQRARRPQEQTYYHFRCPKCDRKLRYPTSRAGRKAVCTFCKQTFTSPELPIEKPV
jgi:hypothetical protein